jgi:ribosome recycling factor
MYDWRPTMQQTARHLAEQLRGIRTGTVDHGVLRTISVAWHGKSEPISRLAVIKAQGDRFLLVPFEQSSVPAVVKALNESRLSAYALNPTTVSVSVPPISIEQREQIVRHVKTLGEEAKIAVRGIRQQARKQIESTGRGSIRGVQAATDAAIEEIERVVKAKVAELI